MDKVLFLDFDGVITTSGTYKKATVIQVPQAWGPSEPMWPNPIELISPLLVANVSEVCLQAGAGIVFTSDWRAKYKQEQLQSWLHECGLDQSIPFYGNTCFLGHRGEEILCFVEENSLKKENFVILEDEQDVTPFRGRQVQTFFNGPRQGFTERHVRIALRLFGIRPTQERP